MIGQTVPHYKILEKLGEVRLVPHSGTDETPSFRRGSSSFVVAFFVVDGSSQFKFVGKRTV